MNQSVTLPRPSQDKSDRDGRRWTTPPELKKDFLEDYSSLADPWVDKENFQDEIGNVAVIKETEPLATANPFAENKSECIHLAVALYSFDGCTQNNELPFFRMDTLVVVNTGDGNDGWWEAYLLGSSCKIMTLDSFIDKEYSDMDELEKDLEMNAELCGEAEKMLDGFAADEWEILKSCSYGYVPASYIKIIASIKNDLKSSANDLGRSKVQSVSILNASMSKPLKFPSRSLPSFHPFVTCGAEEYISSESDSANLQNLLSYKNLKYVLASVFPFNQLITKDEEWQERLSNDQLSFQITSGPSWVEKSTGYSISKVLIADPQHRRTWSGLSEWTVYHIQSEIRMDQDLTDETSKLAEKEPTNMINLRVIRRFTHFKLLHEYLVKRFPAILVPDLPEAPFSGRFRDQFIKKRMNALQRWINRIIRHPVLGSCESILLFLAAGTQQQQKDSIDEEVEQDEGFIFEEVLRKLKQDGNWEMGSLFFSHVYHPEFNFSPNNRQSMMFMEDFLGDINDMEDSFLFMQKFSKRTLKLYERLESFIQNNMSNYEKGMKDVAGGFEKLMQLQNRSDRLNDDVNLSQNDNTESTTSYSGDSISRKWCHNGGSSCEKCGKMEDSINALVKCMNSVGITRDKNEISNIMDVIKEWNGIMTSKLAYLMQIHEQAMKIGSELSKVKTDDPETCVTAYRIASRLGTVLNVIHAEMNHWFHEERIREWSDILERFIENEFEAIEKSREILWQCRALVRENLSDYIMKKNN